MFTTRPNTADQHIFSQVYAQNEYELADLTGAVLLDIGAHIGSFAFKAAACGASSIHSFEPHPSNFALAKSNLEKIPTCHVHNAAVGRSDRAEKMTLDMSDNPLNHGGSCTVTDFGEQVETIGLDLLIDKFEPNFIKIDAEGAEYPALYTCTKLNQIETIIGEFHNGLGTKNMGMFVLDQNTPEFLMDFKGRLNMRSLAEFLKNQGFRVLVDQMEGQVGHFWASRSFQGLSVEPV